MTFRRILFVAILTIFIGILVLPVSWDDLASSSRWLDFLAGSRCGEQPREFYDERLVKEQLERYVKTNISPDGEAASIFGELMQEQDKINEQGESCYVMLDASTATDAATTYIELMTHFVKIGKAEHIQRVMTSYLLAGANEGEVAVINEVLAQQAALTLRLYRTSGLATVLDQARTYLGVGKYDAQQSNMIKLMAIDHAQATAVPAPLAVQLERLRVDGRFHHKDYKKAENTAEALIWLRQVFDLSREIGTAVAAHLNLKTPYDGLLALFQPGYDSQQLDDFFRELIPDTGKIADQVLKMQAGRPQPHIPAGPYELKGQEAFNLQTAGIFATEPSRFHVSFSPLHSLEGGIRGDVRLIVNLSESRIKDFTESNRSTMHELGHGLYIDGIPRDILFTPAGKLMGTGVEEGFAFLVEKIISRSKEYSQFALPLAQHAFGRLSFA